MSILTRSARLSPDGRFRHVLGRTWTPAGLQIAFIGLNPSVADADVDDPTCRRCVRFAQDSGFGRLVMVNLFAFRATRPAELWASGPAQSSDEDAVMAKILGSVDRVVACWGAVPQATDRARQVLAIAAAHAQPVYVLGLSKHGHPRHPLYLPASARPQPWAAPGQVPSPYAA